MECYTEIFGLWLEMAFGLVFFFFNLYLQTFILKNPSQKHMVTWRDHEIVGVYVNQLTLSYL